jgi:hypothetical protein
MSTLNDIKYIAEIHYEMGGYSHEMLVDLIISMFDTYHLMENIKIKEEELLNLIEDDDDE